MCQHLTGVLAHQERNIHGVVDAFRNLDPIIQLVNQGRTGEMKETLELLDNVSHVDAI